ncbi:MAG: nicotinamide-nucleotide amidohydrolase family protein [Spirochaetales bacterium]|nr:nicotinamide-nucleotide amidohydrolase family protein [Spirochaetales bacterium]
MKASEISCSILLVGTELTEGKVRDTNGSFLAAELKQRSLGVREIVLVPDNLPDITEALSRLTERDRVVLISGGLGPTSDDITRDALAAVAGVPLEEREECVVHLKNRGIVHALKTNARQTMIPRGFTVLPNENGTACGFYGFHKALTVCLPGPPGELQPLFFRFVMPLLSETFHLESPPELLFSTFLVSESVLEEELTAPAIPGVSWSTRAEELRVVVTLRGKNPEDLKGLYEHLRGVFGRNRVVPGEMEAADILSRILRSSGKRVVCAESCTGGLVAKLLTDAAGSSDIFWGSFVTYRKEAKERLSGFPEDLLDKYDPVSEPVAKAMCKGALAGSDADVAVAVTGYAGPEGGADRIPVGRVWIALSLKGQNTYTLCFDFRGGRGRIRRQAAVAALLCTASLLQDGERLDSNVNWGYSCTVFPLGPHVQ